MLVRIDPFRELDRMTHQAFGPVGTWARPSVMPMHAWLEGGTFHVELDLPGVSQNTIDLDVERGIDISSRHEGQQATNA
ncbi:Hsp20/alpha crystallin family protein [Pedococcus sp. 2YAF34]|uniref:Hsp20/alpha crystallin family protein n=1 Tax=Pedococcus sp. 2YAF34 TaxID=3233032 RepID=UPI003F9D6447